MKNEIITSQDLIKAFTKLDDGSIIFVPLDKDVSNKLKLLDFQINSYNSLFTSYINSTSEEANKINLQKFLDKFTKLFTDREDTMAKELISKVGNDAYKFMQETGIKNGFNLELNKIQLTR